MALTHCPECSELISDKATSCPKCGFPYGLVMETSNDVLPQKTSFYRPKKNSKIIKIILFLVVGLVVLSLVAWNALRMNAKRLADTHDDTSIKLTDLFELKDYTDVVKLFGEPDSKDEDYCFYPDIRVDQTKFDVGCRLTEDGTVSSWNLSYAFPGRSDSADDIFHYVPTNKEIEDARRLVRQYIGVVASEYGAYTYWEPPDITVETKKYSWDNELYSIDIVDDIDNDIVRSSWCFEIRVSYVGKSTVAKDETEVAITSNTARIRNEYEAVSAAKNDSMMEYTLAVYLGLTTEEKPTVDWGECSVKDHPNDEGWVVTLNGVVTGYPKEYSNYTVSKRFSASVSVDPSGDVGMWLVYDQGKV